MQPLTGIAFRVCATFVFSLMALLIKLVSDHYPTGQLVFVRSFFAIFPILTMLLVQGRLASGLSTQRPLAHLTRIGSGVMAMFCGFAALSYLPLPDVTAIGFAAPLFSVVFSVFLLGEKVHAYRWSAVVLGLVGVVLMFSPHLRENFSSAQGQHKIFGACLALVGAILAAMAMTTVRKLTQTEKTGTIVFYFSLGSTLVAGLSAPFGWLMPTMQDAFIMLGIGLLGGIAQILLTQSYRHAEASLVAPFDYLALLWAIALGWLFFSDLPRWEILAGAGVVILAGIVVIWREHYHMLVKRQDEQIAELEAKII